MGELRNEDVYFETRAEQLLFELERTRGLSRRRLLRLAVAGVPLVAALGRFGAPAARAAAAAISPIVKPLPPEWFVNFGSNAEMRWDAVTDLGYTIPNERFFVRDHTSTPIIDAGSWRLRVFGSGLGGAPDLDHAVEFSYRDLQRLPSRTITTAIECAGNGRSFFDTQQHTPVFLEFNYFRTTHEAANKLLHGARCVFQTHSFHSALLMKHATILLTYLELEWFATAEPTS